MPVDPVEYNDLSSLSRDSDRIVTQISIDFNGQEYKWLSLGQIRLDRDTRRHSWQLRAYLQYATDFEHDSADVLRMSLGGVELNSVGYGITSIFAWVSGDTDGFRVPSVGYNPLRAPGATKCKEKHCANKGHVIVPEGFYCPPRNPELLSIVQGKLIKIITGIRHAEV